MQEFKKSRQDRYRDFIEFISIDIQRERSLVNKRMFSVFLWCFILPAIVSFTVLLFVKLGFFPRTSRAHLDWVVLIFPVFYSLYILGSEVLKGVPSAFKKGGIANTLGQSLKEVEWRERAREAMNKSVTANTDEWRWIVASFRIELGALQYRTRYLTALAGAVFFLIMQGIDTLSSDTEGKVTWTKDPIMGWVETTSNDLSWFVGLGLFLLLLYLSGNQTYQSLNRYLHCAELNLLKEEDPNSRP